MVTASLRIRSGFETRSGQFAQVVEAAEQAATAQPVPFAPGGTKQTLSRQPPRSPRSQQTGNITSICDPLDARRQKVRREPRETVQSCRRIGRKKNGERESREPA
ncbi:hypothetical protein ACQR05_23590 [Bradyrhizobium oligotrophicum]|uniref:hypothetical protein n=1 Tax=Bradyrhizobium TaxID=374 RepID=UPI002916AC7A|nr:hypothetical protein [Bradyrhizobium sp. SZCCHNR1015]